MLKEAASNAKPKKYAQNNRPGIYEGTMVMRPLAAARCNAPKTARGAAKHKLLKATILSKPRARATSALAAHRAITKSRMPALHIETTVREIAKNVASMLVCIWMHVRYPEHVFRWSLQRFKLYDEEPVICPETFLMLDKDRPDGLQTSVGRLACSGARGATGST